MRILLLIFATLLLFSMTIRAQENNNEATTPISTFEELKIKQIESYCDKRSKRECKEEKDANCKELHKNTCIVIETKWIQKVEQECACSSIECDEEGNARKCKNKILRCEKGCIKNACKLRANNECNGEEKSCVKMSRKGCLSAHLPKRKNHGNGKHHNENQHNNEGKTDQLTIPSILLPLSQPDSPKQEKNRELRGIRRLCKRLSRKQCKKDKECIKANTKSCEEKELQWKQNVLTQCACESETCESSELQVCERRKMKCQRRCVRKACGARSLEECKDDKSKKCAKKANRTCRRAHHIRRPKNQNKAHLDKKIRPNKQKNDKSKQRLRGIVRWCKKRARRECKDDRDCNIAKRKACEESEVQWKSDALSKCACKEDTNDISNAPDQKPSNDINANANDKSNDLFNEDSGNIIINKSTRSDKSHHKHHNKGKGKGRKNKGASKCVRKCLKYACKARSQSLQECTSSSSSPQQTKKCSRKFKKACRRAHLGHKARNHHKKNKFLHKYKSSNSAFLKSNLVKKDLPDEFSGIRKFCRRSANKQCKKDGACVDAKIKACEEVELKWRQNALTQCSCETETCESSDPEVCARRTLKCQKRCLKKSCKSRAFDQCRNDSSDDCVKKITRSCKRAHIPRRFNRHLKSFIGSMMKNILLNGVN
eukprot:TRINITY_DN2693_c0_g1_i1.p1 TRINITY_DN2693_c0_g1~~TRINITY_DN2693_c0_g1_i1.p1  ORF type:complete len:657 (-),score=193.12 TRINITY_DN2693_c0_g1_i1:88-2058(-)